MRVFVLAIPAIFAALPALAATCSFDDYDITEFDKGRCTVTEPKVGSNFMQVFDLNDRKIRVEYVSRQGQYHRWKINGAPAAAYEFNRESYCGFTDDLKYAFCFAMKGKLPN